ncbi:MAG: DUF2341 domain-containing protein, partial [Myxococcales bacterium]|nr:DUF2341 domain-containing protein [Myxococcales bacterium]
MSWLGRSWLLLSAAAALAACAAGSTTPAGDGGGSEGIYLPDSRKQPDGFVPQPDTLQPDSPPGLSISVTAPAAASSHAAGAQLAVTWTSSGPITQVAVELWRAGAKVADIAAAQPPSGGTNWTIDGATPGGSDYVVKVRDTASAAEGVSGQFTIVNWAWRSGVDINGAALTASKSDYPVLVTLTPTTIDYARTAAGGADLRFSTQSALSGTFDVPHYIESWNAGGTSKVWVRVKSVPQGQVTTIYMFYGNAGAQSTSSESAVFVNDFVSSGNLTLTGNKTYDRFTLRGGDTLTIQAGAPLSITARSIVIAGTIDGDFAGYAGGAANSAGNGPGGGGTSTNGGAGGGGYGGKGGLGGRDSSDTPGSGGPANGSTTSVAIDMGSSGGGASAVLGGAGGGAITLAAPDL